MSEMPASPPPASPPTRPASRSVFVPAWTLVVVLGVAVIGLGFVIGRASEDHHRHMAGRGGRFLVLLVVVALIVGLVMLIVRSTRRGSAGSGSAASGSPRTGSAAGAENILAERLARGEIDEAEFRRRRDALRG